MIKLSNLADYGVELMCCIALKPVEVHSATGLASSSQIPLPTVSKILGMMVRAGLLRSLRGLKGGFTLALPAAEISIADIIEAVDGPVQLTNCLGDESSDCDRITSCGTRSQWYRINEAVKDALAEVVLSQMIESVPNFIGDGGVDDLPLTRKMSNQGTGKW
ncbi:MAG: SUF system Fe-S cluster assembly regulator [Alphaproteobacteria bacterium]|nr:SUF system Fe-S cluster assembly regulator [Alphaproteobacteria bacterium]